MPVDERTASADQPLMRCPSGWRVRHTTAYDCQARAALRSMLWSIPSRKRIGLRDSCPRASARWPERLECHADVRPGRARFAIRDGLRVNVTP